MKLLHKKGFVQKILIVILTIMMFNFTVPVPTQAADESYFGGKLFKPIFQLLAGIADVPIGLLQHSLLGTTNLIDSVNLKEDDINVTNPDGAWYVDPNSEEYQNASIKKKLHYGKAEGYDGCLDNDGWFFSDRDIAIPNILYCPEYIFSNRIAALDVNFINPNSYNKVEGSGNSESIASRLSSMVSSWYKALRNVAIVGLLSILVYIGIRIIIGSTAEDKAKYKERIKDWLVGLCLLFAMHYIMAGVMMINDQLTYNLSKSLDDKMIYVHVDGYDDVGNNGYFKTNYMGYIRLMVNNASYWDGFAYLMIYIALVIFTVMFTITYIKRVLYMAFFTIIAPLVAMTYPLDKLADGNAQGFNMWFREYMLNAIIQPVHLVLYMVFVGSAIDLAVESPIYAIIAIAFLLPAEKFIKKLFRFDKGQTTSTLGAVAGGALAMKALGGVSRVTKSIAGGGNNGGKDRIKTQENKELLDKRGKDEGLKYSLGDIAAEDGASGLLHSANATNEQNGSSQEDNGVREQRSRNQFNGGNTASTNEDGSVTPTVRTTTATANAVSATSPSDTLSGTSNEQVRFRSPSRIGSRFRRVGGALLHETGKTLGGIPRTAIKGVKKLPRTAIGIGARAAGIAAAGAIAGGAAITSGDAQKAASMLGAGIMVGSGVGGALGSRISDKALNSEHPISETISNAWKTDEERQAAKQKQRDKYDKNWKRREDNYQFLMKKFNGDKKRVKEYLDDDYTQKFLSAGVTDINTIYNARTMMEESNGKIKIEGAVMRAQLASKVSDNFKDNTTEQNAFAERLQRKNNNIDTEKLINEIIKINKRDK